MKSLFILEFFLIFTQIYSEIAEIQTCNQFDACKIVYNHYWGQNEIVTNCACPKNETCLDKFQNDGRSLKVNHRTQIKFCKPLEDIYESLNKSCEEENSSLQVRSLYNQDQLINITITIKCKVMDDKPIYWKRRNSREIQSAANLTEFVDDYIHQELPRCKLNEVCGLIRPDYGFLYQHCTCSEIEECQYNIDGEETSDDVNSELLFYPRGRMFVSRCKLKDSFEDW